MWIQSEEGGGEGGGEGEKRKEEEEALQGLLKSRERRGGGEGGGGRGGETINAPHSAGGAHPAPLREKLAWVVYAGGGAGGGAQVAGSVPPARPSSGPDRRICHLRAGRATAHGLQRGGVGG